MREPNGLDLNNQTDLIDLKPKKRSNKRMTKPDNLQQRKIKEGSDTREQEENPASLNLHPWVCPRRYGLRSENTGGKFDMDSETTYFGGAS